MDNSGKYFSISGVIFGAIIFSLLLVNVVYCTMGIFNGANQLNNPNYNCTEDPEDIGVINGLYIWIIVFGSFVWLQLIFGIFNKKDDEGKLKVNPFSYIAGIGVFVSLIYGLVQFYNGSFQLLEICDSWGAYLMEVICILNMISIGLIGTFLIVSFFAVYVFAYTAKLENESYA